MSIIQDSQQSQTVFEPKTYTVDDIAKILDIGRTSAYNFVKEGHFKIIRIGTTIRISRKSFDDWLDEQDKQME